MSRFRLWAAVQRATVCDGSSAGMRGSACVVRTPRQAVGDLRLGVVGPLPGRVLPFLQEPARPC
jgi:hypothetical protein